MRRSTAVFTGAIFLLLASILLWQQRLAVADWLYRLRQPALPVITDQMVNDNVRAHGRVPLPNGNVSAQPIGILQNVNAPIALNANTAAAVNTPAPLPAEILLDVPFTSQAPYAVWDELHDEACEEASLLMVDAFYRKVDFTKANADQAIIDLEQWQTDQGYDWRSITIAEVAEIAQQRFGYQDVELISNPNAEQIKQHLRQGHPVILPLAGRQVGNSYYRQPGPLYHMLVVTGYQGDNFITNDPGTRRGEHYRYPQERLLAAVRDWNGGQVEDGARVALVVKPDR